MRLGHYLLELCKISALAVGLVACLVVTPSCSPPAADSPDDEIRLAVLSPALADTLTRLGHAELIVGRQQFDRFTDQSVPVVGDLTGIDYETLLRVRPTHIVAQETQAGLPPRLLEVARERGWEIHELPLLTLDEAVASITTLDELAEGSGQTAAALTDRFNQALDAEVALGRTVIVASASPLAVIGPGAFHWEILAALGAQPVPDSGAAYLTLDAESLAALEPETVVVLAPGQSPDSPVEDLLGAAAGIGMPAVEAGRVIVVTDPRCMLPSTAMLDLVERIRAEAERIGPAPGS